MPTLWLFNYTQFFSSILAIIYVVLHTRILWDYDFDTTICNLLCIQWWCDTKVRILQLLRFNRLDLVGLVPQLNVLIINVLLKILLHSQSRACLLKVAKDDRQEQIKHDDFAKENQRHKVKWSVTTHASHCVVHDLVPLIANQWLKHSDYCPNQTIKVLPWWFAINRIRLVIFIELNTACKELHAKQTVRVNEERK